MFGTTLPCRAIYLYVEPLLRWDSFVPAGAVPFAAGQGFVSVIVPALLFTFASVNRLPYTLREYVSGG